MLWEKTEIRMRDIKVRKCEGLISSKIESKYNILVMYKISEMQGQSSVKEKVEHLTQALCYEGHKNLSRSYY